MVMFKNRNFKAVIGMILGSIIYSIGVVWVLKFGEFYAGGITGLSQIIQRLLGDIGVKITMSLFIALLNLPLFIIGWKNVSNRFAILSLASVLLQTIVIFILEYIPSPLDGVGLDRLTLAIVGGLICGIGAGISLRSGSSTGGMDIISQYVYFKKGISFAKFSLAIDFVIIVLGGLVERSIETSIYTSIRLIVNIVTLDQVYTIYKLLRVTIVTEYKDEMCAALIEKFNHGITLYNAIGGYSKKQKWVLESIVSRFEAEEYRNLAQQIDQHSFITFTEVKAVAGQFNQNVIA